MDSYGKLLESLTKEQPHSLSDKILARINQEKRLQARRHFTYGIIATVLSFIASIPAVTYCLTAFKTSGFLQYLSLVSSNSGTVLSYWKELTLSLAETFPVLESISVLVLILVITGSIKYIIESSKTLRINMRFA